MAKNENLSEVRVGKNTGKIDKIKANVDVLVLGDLESDRGLISFDSEQIIKELKRVQREAKEAIQSVKKMQNSDLELLLELASKNGFVLQSINISNRGKGKTTAIKNKAEKDNLLIVVGTNAMVNYINPSTNPDYPIVSMSMLKNNNHRGKRYNYNGFLVDGHLTKEDIELVEKETGLEFKGGFI